MARRGRGRTVPNSWPMPEADSLEARLTGVTRIVPQLFTEA